MKLKRYSFLLFFITLLVTNIIFAQAYNIPRSAVYDAANDRYLISNMGDGDIIAAPRLNPENLSFFNQGAAASIRGMTIVDNVLYAAGMGNDTSEKLFAFDLTTRAVISTITIESTIKIIVASIALPHDIPPAAISGFDVIFLIKGININEVVSSLPLCPPASKPSATIASTPASIDFLANFWVAPRQL